MVHGLKNAGGSSIQNLRYLVNWSVLQPDDVIPALSRKIRYDTKVGEGDFNYVIPVSVLV